MFTLILAGIQTASDFHCSFTHLCRICVSVCAFRYAYHAVSEICEAIAIMTNLHKLDGDLTFENIKLFEILSHYVT